MIFSVKDINIATGGPLVGIINQRDAELLDIHPEDRVVIRRGNKRVTVIIDIAGEGTEIKKGEIGLFKEVIDRAGLKGKNRVRVDIDKRPVSVGYIRKKLEGKRLSGAEIKSIVKDIVERRLSDVEVAYFVGACYSNLMTLEETANLTKAMISTGERLKLRAGVVADKHCAGGVPGNRTTMIVVPILAAAGLKVPKTSSRSITSPAGTADTMEVLASVTFDIKEMKAIIRKAGACIVWGGAINLAPADDLIIRAEYPLSIDSASQLIASILAKKASVSATHVLVDLPIGKGSKIESVQRARYLKEMFESVGGKIGMKVKVIFTDGRQPIGSGMGPALEAIDVLKVLMRRGDAPRDLREKSLLLAGELLEFVGNAKKGNGVMKAREILESGRAYDKMVEIIKAQGGSIFSPEKIKRGRYKREFRSRVKGKILRIENSTISKVARLAGAPHDKYAGVYLFKHVNERVLKGETLLTIYSNSKDRLGFAYEEALLNNPFRIQ